MSESVLIDIGNSRIKWALAGTDAPTHKLYGHGSVEYEGAPDGDTGALLDGLMTALPRDARAAVVVCVGQNELAQALSCRLQEMQSMGEVTIARVRRRYAGLTVAYPRVENLGVDRWVALLGARRRVGYPCVVIDFGTAVTVDAVDGTGQHLGGAIAPGRALQRRSLRQSTARIRAGQGQPVPPSIFARDTGEAVAAGVDFGLAALAAQAHASACTHLAGGDVGQGKSAPVPLLVTGGDAPALMSLLPEHAQHVDDLVLTGAQVLLGAA